MQRTRWIQEIRCSWLCPLLLVLVASCRLVRPGATSSDALVPSGIECWCFVFCLGCQKCVGIVLQSAQGTALCFGQESFVTLWGFTVASNLPSLAVQNQRSFSRRTSLLGWRPSAFELATCQVRVVRFLQIAFFFFSFFSSTPDLNSKRQIAMGTTGPNTQPHNISTKTQYTTATTTHNHKHTTKSMSTNTTTNTQPQHTETTSTTINTQPQHTTTSETT